MKGKKDVGAAPPPARGAPPRAPTKGPANMLLANLKGMCLNMLANLTVFWRNMMANPKGTWSGTMANVKGMWGKLQSSHLFREIQLLACVAGIYTFYLLFGYYQENIMSTKWGGRERFKYTSFLLMIQSIINALCAGLVIFFAKLPADKTPFQKYLWVSVTSIFAMFCSNSALRFVDYPTQVLAKSCKSIPVMFMGLLVFKKKYTFVKYACVIMVAVGIALFMAPSKGHHRDSTETTYFGIFLLLASLALDGLTGPFQDDLIHTYKPSSPHLMYFSNLWASAVMFLVVLVSGDLLPALHFCMRNPDIVSQLALFSLCSALGQNFIFYTIHQFGALTCTTVTTTRKFFTILVSVLWFGHYVSPLQWFAVALVFVGLGVDIVYGYLNKTKSKKV